MSRVVYLNGKFCREEEAKISIFDRGLLFADGVYEVTTVLDGKLVDFAPHMKRLDRSLGELGIPRPISHDELLDTHRELVRANNLREGMVYSQINRGCADRDFIYGDDLKPTLILFTQEKSIEQNNLAARGARLKSVVDLRWARRDIKSVSLLGQVMAKNEAHAAGADEALLVSPGGLVNEGGASSAYIVVDDQVVTRPLSNDILAGVTRSSLLSLLEEHSLKLDERAFSLHETYDADECFLTAASLFVCPVVEIDGKAIGKGVPGSLTLRLREIYLAHARAKAL